MIRNIIETLKASIFFYHKLKITIPFADYILIEDDIILYDNNEPDEDDYYYDAINNTNSLWTLDPETGTVPIPYLIDGIIDFQTRKNIDRAISEFHQKTCIR